MMDGQTNELNGMTYVRIHPANDDNVGCIETYNICIDMLKSRKFANFINCYLFNKQKRKVIKIIISVQDEMDR